MEETKKDKTLELVVNPRRWTFGLAWQYDHSEIASRLELSLQIPVLALSILIQS